MTVPTQEQVVASLEEQLFKGHEDDPQIEGLKQVIRSPFIYMIFEIAYEKGYSDHEKDSKTPV